MRVGRDHVAQEVLRTLAGSVGIVAAVPLTTLLAALVVRSMTARDDSRPSTTPRRSGHRSGASPRSRGVT